jgi:hypothetical protein
VPSGRCRARHLFREDATPIWIPQLAMAFGTILVSIALWDNLVRLVFTGKTNFREEALDAAKVE